MHIVSCRMAFVAACPILKKENAPHPTRRQNILHRPNSARACAADGTQLDNDGSVQKLSTERTWSPGIVRAPRPKRGSVGGTYRVRPQGQKSSIRTYSAPPPGIRIAAGSARGRRLSSPQVYLRPMMGLVREALYSMLETMGAIRPEGSVLDLFAGSGSVGIEALSRGMGRGVFVDAAEDCAKTIQQNLESCGFSQNGVVICARVENVLERAVAANNGKHYDLITITPPYEEVDYGVLMSSVTASGCVGEGTFVVVEYPVELKTMPPVVGGRIVGLRNRRYGRTVIAVYACHPDIDLDPRPDEFIKLR